MVPVALDAGVGRSTGGVVGHVRCDHRVFEGVGEVEDMVVDAELLGHASSVIDVGHRAAPAVGGAAPELQGGPDHVVARLGQDGGGHRGVHSTGHGDEHAHGQARNRSTILGMTPSTWSISSSVVV